MSFSRRFLRAVIVACVLVPATALSQVQTDWSQDYNWEVGSREQPVGIGVDASGNFYVAGWSDASATGKDYVAIKYDASGVEQWTRRLAGAGSVDDVAKGMAVDAGGNVAVTGYTSVTFNDDFLTVKYGPDGDTLWISYYNSGYAGWNHIAAAVAIDGSGNVIVAGSAPGPGGWGLHTVKYNTDGDTLWTRIWEEGVNYDLPAAMVVDAAGAIYIVGETYSNGLQDIIIIKYTPDGDTSWVRTYDGPDGKGDVPQAITVDGSGNVYVVGTSLMVRQPAFTTDNDFVTIKYDAAGTLQWARHQDGTANDYDEAMDVAVDGSGNVCVTGTSYGAGTSGDYLTIKYNSDGDSLWAERFDGGNNAHDDALAIGLDGSGNVYVGGGAHVDIGSLYSQYTVVKYTAAGAYDWQGEHYGSNGTSDVSALVVTGADEVVATGRRYNGSGPIWDIGTVKFSSTSTGVLDDFATGVPHAFTLGQNRPNPFNAATVIEYELERTADVRLTVYDILGRRMATLDEGRRAPGGHRVRWDGDGRGSGVYFYRLDAGGDVVTRKMVLLR